MIKIIDFALAVIRTVIATMVLTIVWLGGNMPLAS